MAKKMKSVAKKNAFSLVELIVALGIIAALTAIAIPAIKAMQKSYDSTGAESMINAALSTARTIAISQQQYAGVRFQKAWKTTDNALNAPQYMIFIQYLEFKKAGNNTDVFRAIEGYKPIKLPDNTGVMDMQLGDTGKVELNGTINDDSELIDTTTFSIIFSPAGKIINSLVFTRYWDNNNPENDEIFNTIDNVDNDKAMFICDIESDSVNALNKEQSRKHFIIYDVDKLKTIDKDSRYDYLETIKPYSLNSYTGEMIKN